MRSNSLLAYIESSDVRKNVSYRLLEAPRSLGELRDWFNVTSPAIVPRIKELEKRDVVEMVDGKYHLTMVGIIAAKKLRQFDRLSSLLKSQGQFFNDHDLEPIPEHLLNRLDEMGRSKLIKNDLENVNATFREVLGGLSTSNSIKGISPIFDPSFPQIILSVAQRGIPISIIVTGNIFKIIKNDYPDALQTYLKHDKVMLYVIEDAKLALAVTDTFTSLSLYRKAGGFDAQTNLMSSEASAQKHDGRLMKLNDANRNLLYATFETDDIDGFLNSISKDPYVRAAETDSDTQVLAYTPTDPRWADQWGPPDIYCPQAWDIQTGSTGITVAILDTGVNRNHEDLSGRVGSGWDFVNSDNNPDDDNGHGTECAGITAAIMNNGRGIAGVSQSTIMPVKVANHWGNATWNNIIQGINYASTNGAKVISMSLSKADYSSTADDACYDAYMRGCVLVAASGNSGIEEAQYPAAFYNVLAVGAVDRNDNIASFSTYGNYMDLVAPGVDIWTTGLASTYYTRESGTSMAAPFVSGVAALVWSQNPSFEAGKIYDVLRSTAVDLGNPGFDNRYGYGKVNTYSAVALGRMLSSTSGSLSGTGNSYTYSVSVPATSNVRVVMAGNENSDFDLYARWNAPPTTSTYDAMGGSGASLEAVTVKGSGTLYIMVYSYSGSGRWKSWAISGNPGFTMRNWGTLSGGMDSRTYSLYGPGIGYAFCSGPDGSDFDLYLKWNSPPSTSSYDSAGLTGWPMEITGPVTNVGNLYHMIYSYSGSGEFTTEEEIY